MTLFEHSTESFFELVRQIQEQGFDEDTAGRYAALIGDTPCLDGDMLVVMDERQQVVARIKAPPMFAESDQEKKARLREAELEAALVRIVSKHQESWIGLPFSSICLFLEAEGFSRRPQAVANLLDSLKSRGVIEYSFNSDSYRVIQKPASA